jgi:hypothetical protein
LISLRLLALGSVGKLDSILKRRACSQDCAVFSSGYPFHIPLDGVNHQLLIGQAVQRIAVNQSDEIAVVFNVRVIHRVGLWATGQVNNLND